MNKVTENIPKKSGKIDIRELLSKELVLSFIFIFFGIFLIINRLFNVDFGIGGIIALLFFFFGAAGQISFFRDNTSLSQLFLGNVFLLLAVFFSESFLSVNSHRIFFLFIYFQITAILMLAFSIRKDLTWLPAVSAAGFLGIILIIFTNWIPFPVQGIVLFWSIAGLFVVLYLIDKKVLYIFFSVISLIFGLDSFTNFGTSFFLLLVLWLISAAFFFLFIKKPDQWWWLFFGALQFLVCFFLLNRTMLTLISPAFESVYWLLGIGLSFLLIWSLRSKFSNVNWTIVPAVILILIGSGIALSESSGADTVSAILFVGIGTWLVLRKFIKGGRETKP